MENYSIIKDRDRLEEFIEWLPELESNEVYYISLLARNKYCKDIVHLNSDRQQLTRKAVKKEFLYSTISQMECPVGSYRHKNTEIPQEALALYIHPNPRDLYLALKRSVAALFELAIEPYAGCNPISEVTSAVATAKNRKLFVDFDYDNMTYDRFKSTALNIYINQEACTIVQTRGGLHVLVKPSRIAPEFEKTWYTKLAYLDEPNGTLAPAGDMLLPVPGCTQGEFVPRIITLDGVIQ